MEENVFDTPAGPFSREELLLGKDVMDRIASKRVILFGVGGVGSWCAECLVRSGVRHLTIVDPDVVCVTNVNRQLPATTKTVGRPKVDVMRERLRDINPEAEITVSRVAYTPQTSPGFRLETYDYIIDAIDTLKNKAHLILTASSMKTPFFSSMGAALKLDPTKIKVDEFWNVRGCPLAASLRRKFRGEKTFPRHKFKCVYSEELLKNQGASPRGEGAQRVNGTVAHVPAIFGMTIAGLVIQHITNQGPQANESE